MTHCTNSNVDIIKELDSKEKLSFVKVEETKNASPRFKVGLGVMPDYLYNEGGMRISAITSKEKPAAKIGLIKGDIVVKIGEYDIIDMMGYMSALSKFNNGDKTTIKIKRKDEFLSFDVNF